MAKLAEACTDTHTYIYPDMCVSLESGNAAKLKTLNPLYYIGLRIGGDTHCQDDVCCSYDDCHKVCGFVGFTCLSLFFDITNFYNEFFFLDINVSN